MKKVVDCVFALMKMSKDAVGGRNFSVQFDQWRKVNLIKILDNDKNMYKLRRDFNDLQFSDLKFNILDILNLYYEKVRLCSLNVNSYFTLDRKSRCNTHLT